MESEMKNIMPGADRKYPVTDDEIQRDFDYYMAQKISESMLQNVLISQEEFNKLTRINRDAFSPFLAPIMPEIP